MVKEKLIIKNFAGFEHIEFDFKPINIFIGPQAAGKSVVVKLAYYFKSYLNDLYKFDRIHMPSELIDRYNDLFYSYFPVESWSNKNFTIKYILDKSFIIISSSRKAKDWYIEVKFSKDIREIIESLTEILENNLDPQMINFSTARNLRELKEKVKYKSVLQSKQYFIPAGRSFFSNIQSNIFALLQSNNTIDPFIIEFGANYEQAKVVFNKSSDIFRTHNKLSKLCSEILKGIYIRDNQIDYLVQKDKRKISLLNASSGQQETFPLLMFIQTLFFPSNKEPKDPVLYIEEPETHLYPVAQKQIVQVLSRLFNILINKQLFITTHSPYILAAFNNLLEAGNIIKEKPELAEKVYKIIPKEEVLDIENFIAYSIKDGKKEVLINEETNLVSQNMLDDASNEIAEEFGKLVDLEFGEE
ncbi:MULTISPECIES: AAA family ATPase [Dysgonomonas]|uniref:Endonuclease GajA/Old nuclease/RecF-like AAA domain-containing protein n=1 Tax=Dysgonomonas gadei ATCC BAA-286 TaxID=742766 RepID=F5J0M7_9BACT|nr:MULTISPECIES: AAA family ATPase [Dysgonomonas]EGK00620.1 hypothetical protein HMPREF9455_02894 [Dysgonomonas gadei ATCC BAA-286]MBF0651954.1 AAA family ATPase [Dysgonomonas sp. GY75]